MPHRTPVYLSIIVNYEQFRERVTISTACAMAHNGIEGEEADRRIREVSEWLEELRPEGALAAWFENLNKPKWTPEVCNRAERLLHETLAPDQLEELKRDGYFHVRAGGKTYRIQGGRAVREISETGDVIATACALPTIDVPPADTMLAQKLLLESCPEVFFAVANVHPVSNRTEEIDRAVLNSILPVCKEAQRDLWDARVDDFKQRIREALDEGERRWRQEVQQGRTLVAIERNDGSIETQLDPV